jgi:hypothetical protein
MNNGRTFFAGLLLVIAVPFLLLPGSGIAQGEKQPAPQPSQSVAERDLIVRLKIEVEKGKIINVEPVSGRQELLKPAERWVRGNWKFKEDASGTFIVPVEFQAPGKR